MTRAAHSLSASLPVELLSLRGWPPAAQYFWSQIEAIESLTRHDLVADFWSGDKERCKHACRLLADRLFAASHGEEALAALMLAADPAEPRTFEIVLPSLAYAVEQLWDWPNAGLTRQQALRRLGVWWRGSRGDFKDEGASIFWITWMEMLSQGDPSGSLETESGSAKHEDKANEPVVVVMPSGTSTKLNNYHSEFKHLLDAQLPLRLVSNIDLLRSQLVGEYPHAIGAIDLVLRDLRENKPVRWTPILLVGPPGAGKSYMVRRIADLLGIGIYRYDGSGASDNMFGGSPKGWGNTVPSAPVRAVAQMRIANPIVLVEEIDKAGTSSRSGRLWDVMLVYLDRETAARSRDVSLDSVVDVSWVLHIATANSIENLPHPLRDRYRIVSIPAPRLADLPQLAANMLRELTAATGEQAFVWPLAEDELAVIGRAWQKAGFSLRNLQRIMTAILDVRNANAVRH